VIVFLLGLVQVAGRERERERREKRASFYWRVVARVKLVWTGRLAG